MSDHLELGVQRAGALHRLQDREQVLGRGAQAFSALTTSASLAPAASWISAPGSCLMEMSAFSATTVWPPDSGPGWLMTGVELIVTDRLPCATAQATA
jgi:hypothetical protein